MRKRTPSQLASDIESCMDYIHKKAKLTESYKQLKDERIENIFNEASMTYKVKIKTIKRILCIL